MDLQRKEAEVPLNINLESTFEDLPPKISLEEQSYLRDLISKSKRPLIVVGKGLAQPSALLRYCERESIPFTASWSSFDKYPDSHPLNVGKIGIYGERAANYVLQNADLVLCIGTRLSIPQVGYDRNDFGRNAVKVVVDIDLNELSKFPPKDYVLIHSDALEVIRFLLVQTDGEEAQMKNREMWLSQIKQVGLLLPKIEVQNEASSPKGVFVHSIDIVNRLNYLLDDDAIIATDVGAGLLSGHYALESNGERTIFTSQGLGEMGFGLPGAIGAAIADPTRQIVCLNTDGGIMFNLQELETVKTQSIPLKLFVFNNEGYAMIKISQANLFDKRYVGSITGQDLSFPAFSKLALTFDFEYLRVDTKTSNEQILDCLKSTRPVLFEVIMSPDQKYFPRLGTRKLADGSLASPGIEDLDPPLGTEVKNAVEDIFKEHN